MGGFGQIGQSYAAGAILVLVMTIMLYFIWRSSLDNVTHWEKTFGYQRPSEEAVKEAKRQRLIREAEHTKDKAQKWKKRLHRIEKKGLKLPRNPKSPFSPAETNDVGI